MKVVHINKSDAGGGAAVAALRIHRALLRSGVDSHMLVQEKKRNEINEEQAGVGLTYNARNFMRFVIERIAFLPSEKESSLRYYFSLANTGQSIVDNKTILEADIIHIHWINQGFLSLKNLDELFKLGKPIVWTLHDMWPFTGGCHYAGSCMEFNEHCGYCPFLRTPSKNDLSAKIFQEKKNIYSNANINIVTCSKWLRTLASESSLLRNCNIYNIANPIDTAFYKKLDKQQCRVDLQLPTDKKLILFGAANLLDIRKGFRYLIEALQIMKDNFPNISEKIELVVFGKLNNYVRKRLSFKVHAFNFVSDPSQLVKIYNAADAFVLPSLQDNLPNTVVESMSCGTPVVGFHIGGVPEMVQHEKNGYLAEVKNSLSLANGLYQTLFFNNADEMSAAARQNATQLYSETTVAQQYINVYKKALENQR